MKNYYQQHCNQHWKVEEISEDQEGKIYSKSIRIKPKRSTRNQVIFTVNIYPLKVAYL